MSEYQITRIVHDEHEVITDVEIAGKLFPVKQVVDWINGKVYTFFTLVGGHRANVYAKMHPVSRRWFLTTDPDGIDENNLDNLPLYR